MNQHFSVASPDTVTVDTLRMLEQASAEMFDALRRRLLRGADAGAAEYDSWAGSLEYDSWAGAFHTRPQTLRRV